MVSDEPGEFTFSLTGIGEGCAEEDFRADQQVVDMPVRFAGFFRCETDMAGDSRSNSAFSGTNVGIVSGIKRISAEGADHCRERFVKLQNENV